MHFDVACKDSNLTTDRQGLKSLHQGRLHRPGFAQPGDGESFRREQDCLDPSCKMGQCD